MKPPDQASRLCILCALCGAFAAGPAGLARAKVSDARLQFKPVPAANVKVGGELGDRLALTAKHLQRLPRTYLLAPFERRTGQVSSGQLVGQWIEFMTDYAASRGDDDLQRTVREHAQALLALQREDGFLGLDPAEMWDGWVANRIVTALLRLADNTGEMRFESAAVRLAKSLAGRFPPEGASAQEAVIGRGVLEALARAYDSSRDHDLLQAALEMPKRDSTRFLDFLTENRRLGYPKPPSWHGEKTYEVLTYLNGVSALSHVAAGAEVQRPLEDAWTDIDRRHAYVTGGLPGVFNWRQGTSPGDCDDAAATADWLIYNLDLWHGTGRSACLETVERILFNHLAFAQAADGQFTSNNDLYGREGHADLAATGEGARALTRVLGAICSVRRRDALVNLYVPSSVRLRLETGVDVTLTQQTAFPADGHVTVVVTPSMESEFNVALRIPSWCPAHKLAVNGQPVAGRVEAGFAGASSSAGYAVVSRRWRAGDRVDLDLTMEFRVDRRPGGAGDTQQVAIWLGPLVMCVDAHYNGGLRGTFRFLAERGREPQLFAAVPPATVGKPVGPFAVPAAASGRAFSAGRQVVVLLTPFASCARGSNAWWRVWLTVYEPQGASP